MDCTKIGKANDFNTVTFLCSERFRKVQLSISFLIVMIFSLKLSAQNSVLFKSYFIPKTLYFP
jgi:hypothetical protein